MQPQHSELCPDRTWLQIFPFLLKVPCPGSWAADGVGAGLVCSPWWLTSFCPKWWKTEAIVLRVFMHLVAFSHSNSLQLWLRSNSWSVFFDLSFSLRSAVHWSRQYIILGWAPQSREPAINKNQDVGFWVYLVILAALVACTLNSAFHFLTCPSVTSPFTVLTCHTLAPLEIPILFIANKHPEHWSWICCSPRSFIPGWDVQQYSLLLAGHQVPFPTFSKYILNPWGTVHWFFSSRKQFMKWLGYRAKKSHWAIALLQVPY